MYVLNIEADWRDKSFFSMSAPRYTKKLVKGIGADLFDFTIQTVVDLSIIKENTLQYL